MLDIESLSVGFWRYRGWLRRELVPVLTGVDLSVRRGELVAIIGQSGAGKSLLAQAILGVLPPTAQVAGRMQFDGQALTPHRQRALRGQRIALVPQGVSWLDPTLRAGRQGAYRTISVQDVRNSFARFDLPAHTTELYPHQLSGGMARRVLTAFATLAGADLLIADEPTTGLDADCRSVALGLLRQLADDGHGVAVITHDLAAILPLADRITILQAGRTIEHTDPDRFRADHLHHPYARALRAALPDHGFHAPAHA